MIAPAVSIHMCDNHTKLKPIHGVNGYPQEPSHHGPIPSVKEHPHAIRHFSAGNPLLPSELATLGRTGVGLST